MRGYDDRTDKVNQLTEDAGKNVKDAQAEYARVQDLNAKNYLEEIAGMRSQMLDQVMEMLDVQLALMSEVGAFGFTRGITAEPDAETNAKGEQMNAKIEKLGKDAEKLDEESQELAEENGFELLQIVEGGLGREVNKVLLKGVVIAGKRI